MKTRAVIGLRCPGAGGKAVVTFSPLQGKNSSLSRCFPSGPKKGQEYVQYKTKKRERDIRQHISAATTKKPKHWDRPPSQCHNAPTGALWTDFISRSSSSLHKRALPTCHIFPFEITPSFLISLSVLELFFTFSFSFLLTDCHDSPADIEILCSVFRKWTNSVFTHSEEKVISPCGEELFFRPLRYLLLN